MEYPSASLSGEHIGKVIPVPIPNTAVKLSEPMIVHTSVKVGIARFLKNLVELRFNKVFLMRAWALQNSATVADFVRLLIYSRANAQIFVSLRNKSTGCSITDAVVSNV